MKRITSSIAVLILVLAVLAVAQDSSKATLGVAISRLRVQAKDILDLDITLRNVSKEPFYVSAVIHPGLASSAYGYYGIETRRRGSTVWKRVPELVADSFGEARARPLSPEEFQVRNNIFLLEPGHSIGRRMTGTWEGLTVNAPGIYELRVLFSAREPLLRFDRVFLTQELISNVVLIEVLP
jgi:hypothetical protein